LPHTLTRFRAATSGSLRKRAAQSVAFLPISLTIFPLATLSLALFAPSLPDNPPQSGNTNNNDLSLNPDAFDRSIWANAKPYLDDSLPDLEATVPELQGLEPASSQQDLNSLLDRIGAKCIDLLHRTPNVISHEEITTRVRTVSVISQGPTTLSAMAPPLTGKPQHEKPQHERYEYLVIAHNTSEGGVLEEYRTDKHGTRFSDSGSGARRVLAHGFINDWLRFYPGNRPESRFRYLGQQVIDNHKALVVAFAQIPGAVKSPAQFLFGSTPVSLLFQGVAWVDSSDFRILRMREDILAPRPDIYLNRFTSKIRFEEIQIPKAASSLWLPKEVDIEWVFKGRLVQRHHVYSDFRLYSVKSKIIPAP
jgi:hypothetical protein